MLRLTAQETARAVGGRLIAGEEGRLLTHISLDSRTMKGNDLFVPVIGERVDAHDFICQALENGASAVFTRPASAACPLPGLRWMIPAGLSRRWEAICGIRYPFLLWE